jgi:hypothetical protein
MAKNQHTFAKRQREMEKKRKAEEKRNRRHNKNRDPEAADSADDLDKAASAQGAGQDDSGPARGTPEQPLSVNRRP